MKKDLSEEGSVVVVGSEANGEGEGRRVMEDDDGGGGGDGQKRKEKVKVKFIAFITPTEWQQQQPHFLKF